MKLATVTGILGILMLLSVGCAQKEAEKTWEISEIPVSGMVTMADFGATECVPCKMMAPFLVELEAEYREKAAILFVDVWKHREMGQRFGIRAIPTQIFYDEEGKEVFRHEGFMDKETIEHILVRLGVEK